MNILARVLVWLLWSCALPAGLLLLYGLIAGGSLVAPLVGSEVLLLLTLGGVGAFFYLVCDGEQAARALGGWLREKTSKLHHGTDRPRDP